ncbi:MAG: hypothetical protein PHE16_02155 [Aliarcobacter sp.]|nr:hypothetical protein [Aliarcobacter sp.]
MINENDIKDKFPTNQILNALEDKTLKPKQGYFKKAGINFVEGSTY